MCLRLSLLLLSAIAHAQTAGTVLDATNNTPLPDAKISLVYSSRQAVTTDDAGRFQLPAPKSPRDRLRVEKQGYATLYANPHSTTLRLSPESTLSGRIPNAPSAPVRLFLFSEGNPLPVTPVLATNGIFHIPALPAGDYKLYAEVETTPASNPRTYYPSALTRAEAQTIHLSPGEHKSGIELTLRKLPLIVFRGRFLGAVPPTGNSFVVPSTAEPTMAIQPGRVETDGTFYLQTFPGQYRLKAMNVGPHHNALLGYLDVTVPANGLDNVKIPALTLRTVRAKFRWLNSPATVPGQPQILLSPMENISTMQDIRPRPDGTSTAQNVGPDRYSLIPISLPPNAYIHSIRAAGADISQPGLDLINGTATDLEITLATDGATITGRAPGANIVSAVPITPHRPIQERDARHAYPDAKGNYTITALAPGEYTVTAKPHPPKTIKLTPNARVKIN